MHNFVWKKYSDETQQLDYKQNVNLRVDVCDSEAIHVGTCETAQIRKIHHLLDNNHTAA
jgi:hypothetical protein